jgi:hypothetical protein
MQRLFMPFAVLALAIPATLLSACGGGDDEPGSDAEYVAAVCTTIGGLQATLNDLGDELSGAETVDEISEALDLFAAALNDAAGDLDDARPPADVRDSHNAVVDAFREAAGAMADGNVEALDTFDPGSIEPPATARQRLAAAAAQEPACQGLGIFEL